MYTATINKTLFVFFLALVVRVFYAWFFVEADSLILEDQMMYIQLGKSMVETGEFLQSTSDGYTMVTDRVPGYPALLALIYTLFGENNVAVVVVQMIIDSLTCVIIALIANLVIPGGFIFAGVVSALNLGMIILSGMILTDTLFLLMFALFILFTLRYIKSLEKLQLFLAISFLCVATLVRSTSYYLVLLLPLLLVLFFIWKHISFKQSMYSLMLYIIVVVMFFGSIHHRNYSEYDSTSWVSQGGKHAIYWVFPATYQYSGNGSYKEGQDIARRYIKNSMSNDNISSLPNNPFEGSSYYMKVAKAALIDLGVLNILHAWSAGMAINFLTPSAANAPVVRAMQHPSFYATPGNGAFEKLLNYVTNTDSLNYLLIIVVGTIISLLFFIVSIFGIYKIIKLKRLKAHDRESFLFLFFIIFYFVTITGPIVGVKYQMPTDLVMTIFFTYALVNFRKNINENP